MAKEDVLDRLPAGISPKPWVIGRGNALKSEMEKRREQVMAITEVIQPTTSRGVAYRLLNFGLIANKDEFRAVVDLVRNMRDNGIMPFDWITDEGRPLWLPFPDKDAHDFIKNVKAGFNMDAWAEARVQVAICVEKLALHGLFLPVAQDFGVPICSTRGFNSITKLKEIAEHLKKDDLPIVIANLGDHDPSGVSVMLSTHIKLARYVDREIVSHRLAVLPEQIERFGLMTRMMDADETAHGKSVKASLGGRDILYPERKGSKTMVRLHNAIGNRRPIYDASLGVVDLDAINPNDSRALLRRFLSRFLPTGAQTRVQEREQEERAKLDKLVKHWPEIESYLETLP